MNKLFSKTSLHKIFTPATSLLLTLLIASIYVFRQFIISTNFSEFVLFDSDCYMRLIRVKELYLSGSWFNNTIPASNYPYGEVLHWSRPLDLLLLAGTYAGMMFTDFDTALYWWGIFISPVLYVFTVVAVYWSTNAYYRDNILGKLNCVLIFITQLFVLYSFAFGRPDHHSLLLLLFTLQIGCALRMLNGKEQYIQWLALASALAMWVCVEAIASIFCILITLLVLGLYYKSTKYFKLAYRYITSLLICLIIFYISGEALSEDSLIVYDKLSIVHIVLFSLVIPVIYAVQKVALATSTKVKIAYLTFTAILMIATGKIFPGLLNPYIDVDLRAVSLWLKHVAEVQPVQIFDKNELGLNILYLSPFILSLPYLLKIKAKLIYKTFFTVGVCIYLVLTLYQIRWSPYLSIISIIPIAQLIISLRSKIQRLAITALSKSVLSALLIILIALGPLILFIKIERKSTTSEFHNYKLKILNQYLVQEFPQPQVILANCDFGAPLLYNSQHKVIATAYHRNYAGIVYFSEVMSSNDYNKIFAALKVRNVDLIVVTPTRTSERVFIDANMPDDAFYNRLLAHNTPAWLTRINLPNELNKDFIIYKVNK